MKHDKAYHFLKHRGFTSVKKLSMFEVRNLLNDFLIEQNEIADNEKKQVKKTA